jgi:hypothetical protein
MPNLATAEPKDRIPHSLLLDGVTTSMTTAAQAGSNNNNTGIKAARTSKDIQPKAVVLVAIMEAKDTEVATHHNLEAMTVVDISNKAKAAAIPSRGSRDSRAEGMASRDKMVVVGTAMAVDMVKLLKVTILKDELGQRLTWRL